MKMYNQDNVEPLSKLEVPLNQSNLLNGTVEFSLTPSDFDDEQSNMELEYGEKLEKYCLKETLGISDSEETSDDESLSPFEHLKRKMINVTEDGKVMKKIEDRGKLEVIGPRVGVAFVHYAAYTEYIERPLDVSVLRHRRPMEVQLGRGQVIVGFEIAIRSMRPGERAMFLVHPDLVMGHMGVPPRIPADATILYDITLSKFVENDSIVDAETDQKEKNFMEILKAVQQYRKYGNELRNIEKDTNGAINKYKNGLNLLQQNLHFVSSEEEALARDEMIKLFSNLSVCYTDKKLSKKVCSLYNDAVLCCGKEAEQNVKLLFNSAKALRMQRNYDEAIKRLKIAYKLAPADKSILRELDILSEWKMKDDQAEKESYKKMFKIKSDVKKSDDVKNIKIMKNVSDEFTEMFDEYLDEFVNSKDSKTKIDAGTIGEQEYVRLAVQRRKLYLNISGGSIIISKLDFINL